LYNGSYEYWVLSLTHGHYVVIAMQLALPSKSSSSLTKKSRDRERESVKKRERYMGCTYIGNPHIDSMR